MAGGPLVVEIGQWLSFADDEQVDPPVVVEVAVGQAATAAKHLPRRAGCGDDVMQAAILVTQQAAARAWRRERAGGCR